MAKAHKVMIDEGMVKALIRMVFRGKPTCPLCGEMIAAHDWVLLNGHQKVIDCSFQLGE